MNRERFIKDEGRSSVNILVAMHHLCNVLTWTLIGRLCTTNVGITCVNIATVTFRSGPICKLTWRQHTAHKLQGSCILARIAARRSRQRAIVDNTCLFMLHVIALMARKALKVVPNSSCLITSFVVWVTVSNSKANVTQKRPNSCIFRSTIAYAQTTKALFTALFFSHLWVVCYTWNKSWCCNGFLLAKNNKRFLLIHKQYPRSMDRTTCSFASFFWLWFYSYLSFLLCFAQRKTKARDCH